MYNIKPCLNSPVSINLIETQYGIGFRAKSLGFEAVAAAKSLQSCPTLRDPMDGSLPGSSVHVIFQSTEVGCHCLLQGFEANHILFSHITYVPLGTLFNFSKPR